MYTCKKGYRVQILKSAAGYYLGTADDIGLPVCRVSGYTDTYEKAKDLTPDRICEENLFCNNYEGCRIKRQ